ncbi:MAG: ABC transporter ATP-binding protein [Lachnospiraceae bacterium]|nr:ABC transporter ATP-binding protein [Lachnospiraceae bacterium]
MIQVNNLTMSYGSKTVLNKLCFQVKDNCITGFLGANGAGKSTTMNLLTGYLVPKSGEIIICDKNMLVEPIEARRNIGYLPEIPPLYKDMRIEEYLRYIAEIKGVGNKKDEVSRVLNLMDMEDRRHEFIKKLSKGYGQRVGFAGALIGDPKVLILDEPLVGLDPVESKRTRDLLKQLQRDHCIFISSHILSEIEELCTEIIMIKDGEIVIDDAKRTIKNNSKENKYSIQVKGKKDEILTALSNYSNLKSVTCEGEIEEGLFEFVVTSKNSRDIRDSILSYLVGKKYIVYGISKQQASLEDVFIQVNDGEEM